MTALVLIGIVLMMSTTAVATDLPAQEGRIWAPTGDLIGLENHATVGGTSWDPHGNKPKYAEDWQQEDDLLFNGLFGFSTVLDSGRRIVFRGIGESGRGTLASRVTFLTSKPDQCRVTFDFRNFNNFYDPTSEMRASSFKGMEPPSLANQPSLGWTNGSIGFAYNLGRGFGLDLGFTNTIKDGTKGSLLRGATGSAVPNIKQFDTTTNEFLVGLGYGGTSLDVNAQGVFRKSDGDRSTGLHTYKDDQTLFRAGLDATYRFNNRTSMLGAVSSSQLEAKNDEAWGANIYSPNGDAKTTNGRLGLITRLGKSTVARATVGVGTWNTEQQTDLAAAIEQATIRDRSSLDIGLLVTNSSLKKTRLRFDYRFRSTKLEEATSEGSDQQTIDQDRMSHRANLRAGIRLFPKGTLKGTLGWQNLTIDQTNGGDEIFYTMGDRKQNRFSGRLALQTRPLSKMRLDVGVQGHDQRFERKDVAGVETTNMASQGFLGLNYSFTDRLTFLGTGSYGLEKFNLQGSQVADAGMGPLTYKGKTLRFAPGLIWQPMDKLELEGHYEGVRFEDPGDAPHEGNQLNSDLNRMLVRAGYRVGVNLKVSATYRRHEFEENRWDNYKMDLYSLSFSGRF
jgi:hypothetical protein